VQNGLFLDNNVSYVHPLTTAKMWQILHAVESVGEPESKQFYVYPAIATQTISSSWHFPHCPVDVQVFASNMT